MRFGVNSRFDFKEQSASKFHAREDVQAYIKIEITEVNGFLYSSKSFKALARKHKTGSRAGIGGPAAELRRKWQPVDSFKIKREKLGDLSPGELSVWAKRSVS
jgi:hypothetical protein